MGRSNTGHSAVTLLEVPSSQTVLQVVIITHYLTYINMLKSQEPELNTAMPFHGYAVFSFD